MIMKTLYIILATAIIVGSTPSWAFDKELAASYENLFRPVVGENVGKELHLIKPEAFVNDLKKGKKFVALDVRTPAESVVFTMVLPESIIIPVNELFKEENLARLPKDKQIVVVCKSGTRASVAGTALRHIGFNNISILKGGFKALSVYLDPVTANTPAKTEKTNMK